MSGPSRLRLAAAAALSFLPFALLPAQGPGTDNTPAGKLAPPPEVIYATGARSGDPVGLRPSQGLSAAMRASGAALQADKGVLWGLGDNHKASFGADGFEFIPALGRQAPRNYPVGYQMLTIGRGTVHQAVGSAVRETGELQVRYVRPAVVERYDMRPEGIEQSFVFDRLPPGEGDLVVTGKLTTGLTVQPDGEGLLLELPGVGGMRIGGVTGIDARGRRAAGEVRYRDGMVEYSLPAAFVAGAALPLVLDPLVGSVFQVIAPIGSALDDQNPDVAFDATNDRYLVTFERVFSGSDWDIHGTFVSAAGAPSGTRIFLENSTAFESQHAACNINLRDHFVVVYVRNNDIQARSVNAATGAVSAELLVAGGADLQFAPDVGGEATTVDDDAICVWHNSTQTRIEAAQIGVNADGTIYVWDLTTIFQDSGSIPPAAPRISKSGGATGRHMIVWRRDYSSGNDSDPQGAIVDREITILDDFIWFDSATTDQDQPDVDGDGYHWVCGWETEVTAGSGDNDLAVRSCSYDPNTGQGILRSSIVIIEGDVNDNEISASVCWAGGSWLVGFADQIVAGGNYDAYFKSLDPFTCLPCENEFYFAGSRNYDFNVQMASQRSGGSTVDQSLVVIETLDLGGTNTSQIEGQLFRSDDGTISDWGGGCGTAGGVAYATCARAGNSGFTMRLLNALAGQAAVLVISTETLNWACGSCRLIPNPYTGFVIVTSTSGNGFVDYALPIPPNPGITGLSAYAQWIVTDFNSPSCLSFNSDLSAAFRLTVQ